MALCQQPDEGLSDEIVLTKYPLLDSLFDGQGGGSVIVDIDWFRVVDDGLLVVAVAG
jgi:hypothetical protein